MFSLYSKIDNTIKLIINKKSSSILEIKEKYEKIKQASKDYFFFEAFVVVFLVVVFAAAFFFAAIILMMFYLDFYRLN